MCFQPPARASLKLLYPLTLVLLSFSACFPMGIPEYFSPQVGLQPSGNRVLLIRQESQQRVLGHQYLLLLFPFTYLYLEHGQESLIIERYAHELGLIGYDVSIADKDDIIRSALATKPALILAPELSELSVNAYDALFLRIIRVSGQLKVRVLSEDGQLIDLIETPISQTAYKKKGQATALALLLERSLSEAFVEINTQLGERLRRRQRWQLENNNVESVIIQPPTWRFRPTEDLINTMTLSYIFHPTNKYDTTILSRIIQRGLAAGIDAPSVESLVSNNHAPAWQLSTAIAELEQHDERLHLQLHFTLRDAQQLLLKQLECSAELEEQTKHDGSWVYTLETVSEILARDMFEDRKTYCKRILK